MNKIVNWTVGSFFRTIGRTIAFLVMGGIIYYIFSVNGIDFGIKNLFFDKVKAENLTTGTVWVETWTTGNSNWSNNSNMGYIYAEKEHSTYTSYNNTITINNSFTRNSHGDIYINGYIRNLAYNSNQFECTQITSNGCEKWTSGGTQISFQLWIDGYNSQCTIDWNDPPVETSQQYGYLYWNATCKLVRNTFNTLKYQLYAIDRTDESKSFYLGINKNIMYDIPNNENIINSIDSQTQQQQQQHEEMMDSNTTQAESDAQNFFEDFSVDLGGLTGIITAPLNTIRSLLNSTCTNLVLPLPFVNKNLTLPCMNSIYTEHFGLFFSLYQTIILGIIAYRCIMSIFFDIKGFSNPDDDRIEVMDL